MRLASITLAAALCAGSIPCASQDGQRPSVRSVSPPKVIRTHRPRIADDFFKQEAVHFERAPGLAHRDGQRSEWNNRALSAQGLRDAQALAVRLAAESPATIYSSPYLRARQTVEPLARHLRIAITQIDDLRERLLGAELTDDWSTHMRRAWRDFDYCLGGGESSRQAQRRVLGVLQDLRARHATGTIVAASHGNLIALALDAMAQGIDYDFWNSMPWPAVYSLTREANGWLANSPGLR